MPDPIQSYMFDIKVLKNTLDQLEKEKKIPQTVIIDALEMALAAAYKKDFGKRDQIIKCSLNLETGTTEFFQAKVVVDESTVRPPLEGEELQNLRENPESDDLDGDERPRFNPERHIMINDARRIRSAVELGDEISFPIESVDAEFGRVAAQTAKQVIMQRLREAERDSISREYADKEGHIVTGVVQRYERGNVFIDLGRAIGIITRDERIEGEFYRPGQHIKVFLYRVDNGHGEVTLRLSRAHPLFIEKLFAMESPEVANGIVELKSIAREPGNRTKIAVFSNDESIDAIGSCVGQKGTRVNAVTSELNNEKIDIIPWSTDTAEFVANSLLPARVIDVTIDEESHTAHVTVAEDQLSLAIGKGGQNARLAARLTGWKIDIKGVPGEAVAIDANEFATEEDEGEYTSLNNLIANTTSTIPESDTTEIDTDIPLATDNDTISK